jgi:adenine-specific DNA-methyltransferase
MNNYRFDFPKSLALVKDFIFIQSDKHSIVLDFFAGSGTTVHAVMKLNKEDRGKRKFILVEMAYYFDTVIIPRIKKVAYSFNWREGKPQGMDGTGGFFKYHTLEQYEDALENIEFEKQDEKQQKFLFELPDYFVKYMLEWETRNSNTFLNLQKLKDPFDYKLKIIENYQQKTVNVDVVETFNYLLGLHIKGYRILEANDRKYIFVFGEKDGKRIAIVWRNVKDINFEKDREVIEKEIKDFSPDEIYINGDALVKGFNPIEPVFKNLMFERMD